MRKFASLLTVLMLLCALAFGQSRTVTGQVRTDKGEVVPFATVTEAGTRNATKADGNGYFAIKVKDGSSLSITAAGYEAKTVAATSGNNQVVLVPNGQMAEVVVTTALGIKRRPKEVGYANTTLKNDQITVAKSPNLGQSLSGQVAGLTIFNTNGAVNSQPRIVLRGDRSITGNNTALIVVDGVQVPNGAIGYLNPNDVESVTVLKGGQGGILYGSAGANGVILITTKKGTNLKPTITFTSTVNADQIAYLPKFQTGFGSGSGYGLTQEENFRPFENQQYGDAYDGSIRAAGRKSPDGKWLEVPYQFIPGIRKKIWDVGITTQNDVSVSGGDANSSFYLSFQDANVKGVVPKDEYRRDALRFNASKTFGKFKASFDATYAIDHTQRTNADFFFYALNTPGWIPLDQLKDWKNNYFASPNGYFNDYYDNPWFELDNNRNDGRTNTLVGNMNLNFKPVSWLEINYRLATTIANSSAKSWTNRYDYSDYAKGLLTDKPITKNPAWNDYSYNWRARNAPITGAVSDGMSYSQLLNSELYVTLSKNFGDFSGKLILGNSAIQNSDKSIAVASSSVIIPELFNVGNRSGELTSASGESNHMSRTAGNFADLTVGYKDYLFIHGAVRDEVASVFYSPGRPTKLYNYPWYGGDVSLILTDLVPSIKSDILSYVKLRAGWNTNGNANIAPYSLSPQFFTGGGFPYGSNVGITVGNDYPDPNLKPEIFHTTEVGAEMTFWKGRINADVTWYKTIAGNQILGQSISSSTGYLTTTLNAAKVDNHGIESEVRANVYKTRNWSVDLNANYTFSTNKVLTLSDDLSRIQLNSASTYAFIYAEVGQPFPYLKTTYYQVDSATGGTIIDPSNGWPKLATGANSLKGQGTTAPKHQLGVGFRASFKNFSLTANAEYRGGNVVFSNLGNTMAFTGSSAITTLYNREQFIWPNSVYFDGSKYVPNTSIPTQDFLAIYQGWGDYGFSNGVLANGDFFTSSAAFWKLRAVSLAYEFGQSVVRRVKVVKGINLSIWGRNLVTLLPKDNYYTDPEFSNTTGNGIGINVTGNTPAARQYGATLSVRF